MWLNILLFGGCLALVLWASELLARGLDRLGSKLQLSEELLGLVTALGADSPEIASAIVALSSNQRDLGVGIVLGSNLFNLAALLGLGAVLAGHVRARSAATVFNGLVALAVLLVSAGLIGGLLHPSVAAVLVLLIVLPYVYLLAVNQERIAEFPIPSAWKHFLAAARFEAKEETQEIGEERGDDEEQKRVSHPESRKQSWKPAWLIIPALALIVLGSIGMVNYATAIGHGWLPDAILGTFVLASLTGLPNTFTAVRLARHGKGAAVITETFNSNTINILVGLLLPALILGQGTPSSPAILDLSWLVLMTLLAILLSASSGKLTRNQGILLLALYLAFVGTWMVLFLKKSTAG